VLLSQRESLLMPRLRRALALGSTSIDGAGFGAKKATRRWRNEGLAMKAAGMSLALVAAALTGCSAAPSLTTGSILGGPEKPAAVDPGSVNDPTNRAFQVGMVSAKAIKCGFNFDPAKLKTNYLSYERTITPGGDLAKVEKIYDVSFNGVAKAVAGDSDFCSEAKTKTIKADLSRHLAGDYTPAIRPKEVEQDGVFGSLFAGDSGQEYKQRLPTDNRD
jgi:hypothetical protein